jgi:hypothetical protein
MMMNIDRNNYEICFIDYLDGNLSLEEIDMLLDFLNENPDLKEELKGLEQIKIEELKGGVPSFNHLKKTDFDHPEIFEETCIRAIENDLAPQEMKLFRQHLYENREHHREFEVFQATISEPDPFIIYDKKQQLKKQPKFVLSYVWYAAAVLLLGLFLFIPTKKIQIKTPEIQVAEVVKPVTTETPVVKNKTLAVKQIVKAKTTVHSIPKERKETPVEEVRIAEIIEPLTPIKANAMTLFSENEEMALVPIVNTFSIKPSSYSRYLTLPEYFAGKIDEAGNKGLLARFALNTLKKLSGDKFDYSTTNEGKVERLEFNSKLLAFTIPLNDY